MHRVDDMDYLEENLSFDSQRDLAPPIVKTR